MLQQTLTGFEKYDKTTRRAQFLTEAASFTRTSIGQAQIPTLRQSPPAGATPTNLNEMAEIYLDKLLASNVYFRLFGRLGTLLSDGAITVEVRGGEGQFEITDKNAWLTGPAEYVFTGVFDQG